MTDYPLDRFLAHAIFILSLSVPVLKAFNGHTYKRERRIAWLRQESFSWLLKRKENNARSNPFSFNWSSNCCFLFLFNKCQEKKESFAHGIFFRSLSFLWKKSVFRHPLADKLFIKEMRNGNEAPANDSLSWGSSLIKARIQMADQLVKDKEAIKWILLFYWLSLKERLIRSLIFILKEKA